MITYVVHVVVDRIDTGVGRACASVLGGRASTCSRSFSSSVGDRVTTTASALESVVKTYTQTTHKRSVDLMSVQSITSKVPIYLPNQCPISCVAVRPKS